MFNAVEAHVKLRFQKYSSKSPDFDPEIRRDLLELGHLVLEIVISKGVTLSTSYFFSH